MQSAVTYVEKFPHGMERGRLFLALHEYYMRIGDINSALYASVEALHLPWTR